MLAGNGRRLGELRHLSLPNAPAERGDLARYSRKTYLSGFLKPVPGVGTLFKPGRGAEEKLALPWNETA
jgi:hypothetical protein